MQGSDGVVGKRGDEEKRRALRSEDGNERAWRAVAGEGDGKIWEEVWEAARQRHVLLARAAIACIAVRFARRRDGVLDTHDVMFPPLVAAHLHRSHLRNARMDLLDIRGGHQPLLQPGRPGSPSVVVTRFG